MNTPVITMEEWASAYTQATTSRPRHAFTASEYAAHYRLSPTTAKGRTKRAVCLGLLRRVGSIATPNGGTPSFLYQHRDNLPLSDVGELRAHLPPPPGTFCVATIAALQGTVFSTAKRRVQRAVKANEMVMVGVYASGRGQGETYYRVIKKPSLKGKRND
jgi:hypothetical protein